MVGSWLLAFRRLSAGLVAAALGVLIAAEYALSQQRVLCRFDANGVPIQAMTWGDYIPIVAPWVVILAAQVMTIRRPNTRVQDVFRALSMPLALLSLWISLPFYLMPATSRTGCDADWVFGLAQGSLWFLVVVFIAPVSFLLAARYPAESFLDWLLPHMRRDRGPPA